MIPNYCEQIKKIHAQEATGKWMILIWNDHNSNTGQTLFAPLLAEEEAAAGSGADALPKSSNAPERKGLHSGHAIVQRVNKTTQMFPKLGVF